MIEESTQLLLDFKKLQKAVYNIGKRRRRSDSDGNVKNQSQYHKAIFAARNADTIAQHFYEQGKADAVRNITAKSNNVSGDVRQSAPDSVFVNGFSVKAINGVDSSRLKIRKK